MIVACRECKQTYDVPVTDQQLTAWQGGELIQNVMPNLTPDQRELLISGTCNTCWNKMFVEER